MSYAMQPQSSAANQNWFSSLGKSISNVAKSASDAVQSVMPTTAPKPAYNPSVNGQTSSASLSPATMRQRLRSRQGGKKTRKHGGAPKPNISLTNLASTAAPIKGIESAQPQAYVGGSYRSSQRYKQGGRNEENVSSKLAYKRQRSRQAMYAGYKKGSKSKTRKGDMDFTTKRGDKVFHQKKHYVKKSRKPYSLTLKNMLLM